MDKRCVKKVLNVLLFYFLKKVENVRKPCKDGSEELGCVLLM